jgi:hypothetical protein
MVEVVPEGGARGRKTPAIGQQLGPGWIFLINSGPSHYDQGFARKDFVCDSRSQGRDVMVAYDELNLVSHQVIHEINDIPASQF